MLYNEFIEGTGCKDNEHNYQIYKRLELMYMADDSITKAEIYEYGKKLVDNSKSQKLIEFEEGIKRQIANYRQLIEQDKRMLDYYKAVDDKVMAAYNRNEIKGYRARIRELKWVLA